MIKVIYKGKNIVASSWEEVFSLMKWVDDSLVDYKSICLSGGAVEVV